MEFETLRLAMVWAFNIFWQWYFHMMSYDNSIFNMNPSLFSILVSRYRVYNMENDDFRISWFYWYWTSTNSCCKPNNLEFMDTFAFRSTLCFVTTDGCTNSSPGTKQVISKTNQIISPWLRGAVKFLPI